ncbi:MAG: 30S ribosomal protein S20 [Planctomycetota bacterium]
MAQSLQAKKRAKQNVKSRTTNRARKSRVKTQIKHFEAAVDSGDVDADAQEDRLSKEVASCQATQQPQGKEELITVSSTLLSTLYYPKTKGLIPDVPV